MNDRDLLREKRQWSNGSETLNRTVVSSVIDEEQVTEFVYVPLKKDLLFRLLPLAFSHLPLPTQVTLALARDASARGQLKEDKLWLVVNAPPAVSVIKGESANVAEGTDNQ